MTIARPIGLTDRPDAGRCGDARRNPVRERRFGYGREASG